MTSIIPLVPTPVTPPEPSYGMERLSQPLIQHISSFLSAPDQGRLARIATFAGNAARDTQQYYTDLMTPLATAITALPATVVAANFQQHLINLVTSPIAGNTRHWVPVMKDLMGRLTPYSNHIDTTIQQHALIANLLAPSQSPISSDQIYQFCRHIGKTQLSRIKTWIGYRSLEKYLLNSQLNSTGINKAIKEYLTSSATELIKASDQRCWMSNDRMLNHKEIIIDPRIWFGLNGENSSLWQEPGAATPTASMPPLLLEALWTRIQSLRASCMDQPFTVSIRGRAEAETPRNFTLPLAQLIINASIFLDHNYRIGLDPFNGDLVDEDLVDETSRYETNLSLSSDDALERLAEEFPRAITLRDSKHEESKSMCQQQ